MYMTKTRSLGKIFGVEVKVHGTFLLLLAFIAISGLLNGGLIQSLLSVTLAFVVFGIVVLHEFGHILAARKFGIPTKDVILSPLGGMARLQKLPANPYQEMVVAAAGPAVNLVLAGIGLLIQPLVVSTSAAGAFFAALLGWFITINLVLIAFNLIPALPMDGGRILRAALTKKQGHLKATQTAARVARWSALAMAIYAVASGQLMLLIIAAFVFGMSWVEVMQAKMQAAQTNPLYQVFQHAQRTQQRPSPSGHTGQVVDQYGNPVDGPSWSVRNVRWADDA